MAASPLVVVLKGKYYTDGSRLYYIEDVHEDNTITVENCITEFTHRICTDIIDEGWRQVNVLPS